MNKFKKIMVCFALIFACVLCSATLFACSPKNSNSNEAEQIDKAMGTSIETMETYSNTESTVFASALAFEEVNESLSDKLFLLQYMHAVVGSNNFEYQNLPFKSNMSVGNGTATMNMYALHSYKIDGNDIEIKMVFTYEESFDNADYECMNINYDFENDTLVSFNWYTYLASGDGVLYCINYENSVLKTLVIDYSEEYTTLKEQVKADAQNFYNTKDVSIKVYNFSQEYVDVYNSHNPENPIQVA